MQRPLSPANTNSNDSNKEFQSRTAPTLCSQNYIKANAGKEYTNSSLLSFKKKADVLP